MSSPKNLALSAVLALMAGSWATLPSLAETGEGPEAVQSALDHLYLQHKSHLSKKGSSRAPIAEAEQELGSIFDRRAKSIEKQKQNLYQEIAKYRYHSAGAITLDATDTQERKPDPDFDPEQLADRSREEAFKEPLPYLGPFSPEYQATQTASAPTAPEREDPVIRSKDGPREIIFPGRKPSPSPSPR